MTINNINKPMSNPIILDTAVTVSYYKNLFGQDQTKVDLIKILDGVKNGKYKGQILALRKAKNKTEIKKIKNSLPCFTVSGTFPNNERKVKELINHTGLIQIDFDSVKNLDEILKSLKNDQYTFCAFISPSGNGIKLIVKIAPDPKKHIANFKGLESYYLSKYGLQMDQSTKDVSRLFFVSHDENLYINHESLEFVNSSITTQAKQTTHKNDKFKEVDELINQIQNKGIDITNQNGYEGWLKIGFALSSEFGSAGSEFFHRLSSMASNYNQKETEAQFQKCLNSNSSGVTISSLFHVAKEVGVKINGSISENETATESNSKNPYPKKDLSKNGFYLEKGGYYMKVRDVLTQITNYKKKVKYFFPDGSNNAGRLIELENEQNGKVLIELTAQDLSALQKYKGAIRSKGNFSFRGSSTQLDKLIEVHCKKEITAHKLNALGFEPESGVYSFSNGVLDQNQNFISTNEFGVVELPNKSIYIPSNSVLAESDDRYKTERTFCYKKGIVSFEDWSNLFQSAFGTNGVIGTAFLVSALFRDVVFKQLGNYPFLFLFGSAGGGKTTFATHLLSAFVNSADLWSTTFSSTDKAIARKVTLAQNSIIYIKEFDAKNVKGSKVQFLKNAYDGVGYERAQTSNDNRTHQTAVKSALLLDGNFLPTQESALFDRFVVLYFDKSNFSDTSAEAKKEIEELLSKGAGQIIGELLKHRSNVLSNFSKTFYQVLNELKFRDKQNTLSARTKSNLASIGSVILSSDFVKCKEYKEKLINALYQNAKEQETTLREIDEVSVFWQAVCYYKDQFKNGDSTLIGLHFKPDHFGVKLNIFYSKYIEYINSHNIETHLKKADLKKHICRDSYIGLLQKNFETSTGDLSVRYDKYDNKLLDNTL